MQQLQLKLKNVPTDAPQVRSTTSLELNKDQSLSASSIVLDCNNPEVDLPQQTEGLKAAVFVLSVQGLPLMPCSPSKARKLMKNGKANVLKLYPFTIKLTFECENKVQPVILGIDSGFKNIGFSCVTQKQELISGTVILDDKTTERLTERRMYRRGRRNKLWYRKPRFSNRKRKEGWLPPSVQRRYDTHLGLIRRLKAIIPISEIIIETANFDIQKIENSDIEGEQYQQGDLYGYQNVRSFLMAREHGLCQLCSKEFTKDNTSHIHHCKQRSESGSSRTKNLAILHEKCHIKLHKQGLKLKAPKQYKQSTFMSIIHKKFWTDVPGMKVTYGYITFIKRHENKITKSHNNDAFVIANGTGQPRSVVTTIRQKHRNNRAIQMNRKGFAPSVRKKRYSLQPKDLFWIGDKKYVVKGIQNKGAYVMVEESEQRMSTKKIDKSYHFGSFSYN